MTDLGVSLKGKLSFISTREGFDKDPMEKEVNFPIVFRNDRKVADATGFVLDPIGPFPVDLPFGITADDTLSVTLDQGGIGTFAPTTGKIEIPLVLRFEHSLVVLGPSTLALTVTTESVKPLAPLKPARGKRPKRGANPMTLTLVAAGIFQGDQLDGFGALLKIKGTLAPSPFP